MAWEAAHLLPPVLLVLLASGSWQQRIVPELLHAIEGETISVPCKYLSWDDANRVKTWCRQISPTEYIRLVTTSRPQLVAPKSRYTIRDNRHSGNFIVTMTKLRKKDSGFYWCAIETSSRLFVLKIIQLVVSPASTLPATRSTVGTTAWASTVNPVIDSPPDNWTFIIPATVVAVLLLLALTIGVILYIRKARGRAKKDNKESQHIYEDFSTQKTTDFNRQVGSDEDTGDIHYASLTYLNHFSLEDAIYTNTHPNQRPTPDPFLSVEYASVTGNRPQASKSPALEGDPRN